MIGFWVLAVALLLAAYALFGFALLGKKIHPVVDRQKLNLSLHEQRRAELSGELSAADRERLEAELDKDLLADLAAIPAQQIVNRDKGWMVLVIALIGAPLLGLFLYGALGRYDLADFRAEAQAEPQKPAIAPEIQAMIDKLANRLKQEPNDIKGWLLLGRSYQQTEQLDQAVEAYQQALKLSPDDLDIQATYAQALGDSQQNTYTGEPERIAAGILSKNPKHHSALWLAGLAAAQQGNGVKALGYLETLRADMPKGSQDEQFLTKVITDIKGKAGEAQAAPQMPATGEQKSIQVKVSLSPSLQAKAAPEDMLFVFAKAASGPPMPLAIVRKQVKDLPISVTLDDSMAMMEGMNLSAFDQLVIGARISKTGQALPKSGDLQGLTPPVTAENGGSYSVEIKEVVP